MTGSHSARLRHDDSPSPGSARPECGTTMEPALYVRYSQKSQLLASARLVLLRESANVVEWSRGGVCCVFTVMFFVCTDSGCVGKSFVKASSKQIIGLRKLIVLDVTGTRVELGGAACLIIGRVLLTTSTVSLIQNHEL